MPQHVAPDLPALETAGVDSTSSRGGCLVTLSVALAPGRKRVARCGLDQTMLRSLESRKPGKYCSGVSALARL